jgi:hypothetical protein
MKGEGTRREDCVYPFDSLADNRLSADLLTLCGEAMYLEMM